MKNKKNMNLEYLEIKSLEDLRQAVFFLEKGFKWDKVKSNLAISKLPIINRELNSYGIMIKANGDIVGAILFFHQGFLKIGYEKKSIINLSGWYIDKEFRGTITMSFLRYMLKKFGKCIITSYSANPVAEKIYSAIGFKKMKLKRASLLLFDCILSFSKIKIKDIQKDSLKIVNNIETTLDDGVGIRFFELEIDQENVQLIVKKRLLKRSLFGVKFNWRTLTILWSSNETLISEYWKKVSNKLLLHTKSMKLICDFYSNFPQKVEEKENNYLFFSNDYNINYISPIQSEMNVFD